MTDSNKKSAVRVRKRVARVVKSTRKTYTPRQMLLPLAVAEVCRIIILEAIPDSIKEVPEHYTDAVAQMAGFFNHMLVNTRYSKQGHKGSSIMAKDGTRWYPLIFGGRALKMGGIDHYIKSPLETRVRKDLPTIDRLLERLIEMDLVLVGKYKAGFHPKNYSINPKLLERFTCFGLFDKEKELKYATLKNYMTGDEVVGPVSNLLSTLPTTHKELKQIQQERNGKGKRAAIHDFESDPYLSEPYNKTGRARLRACLAMTDVLVLNTENLDEGLRFFLKDAHLRFDKDGDVTKAEVAALRMSTKHILRMIRDGCSVKKIMDYMEANRPSEAVRVILSRCFTRYVKASGGVSSILRSGNVYYKPRQNRLYYYPSYRPTSAGGRSYEAGGFQTLPRQMKQFLVRDCPGVNLDIKSCHFVGFKELVTEFGLEEMCPEFMSFEDVDGIIERFHQVLQDAAKGDRHKAQIYERMDTTFRPAKLRGIMKYMLYSNFNNGGAKISLSVDYKTTKQLQSDLEKRLCPSDATECRLFLTSVWNRFCSRIGLFSTLKAIIEKYWNMSNIVDREISVRNEVDLTIKLPVDYEDNGTPYLYKTCRKRLFSHILTGKETSKIQAFLMGNKGKVLVQAFEHDGLYLTIKKDLDWTLPHNEGFAQKPFGDDDIVESLGQDVL